jgi:hypothetical protein
MQSENIVPKIVESNEFIIRVESLKNGRHMIRFVLTYDLL